MSSANRTLALFNPEHDLVLGANEPHYIAPATIRKMKEDLSLLPLWYAPRGAEVLVCNSALAHSFLATTLLRPQALVAQAATPLYHKVSPWGWNQLVVKTLLQQGVCSNLLPTPSQLASIRTLSGRGLAVYILQALGCWANGATSAACYSLDEVISRGTQLPKTILKAPWSGSGKGLRFATGRFDKALEGWVKRTLATQGYVVVEPFYDKRVDFAMEFESLPGEVRFVGYSIFETDDKGSYQRGILGSNEQLEARLSAYLPGVAFQALQQQLETLLGSKLGDAYQGYLGVDMMVCQNSDGSYWLHPCVEINLRMNMGVVARLFYDRYVVGGSEGYYVVSYHARPGALVEQHRANEESHPLLLEQGRIASGYCSLTPVAFDTHYQAYVLL